MSKNDFMKFFTPPFANNIMNFSNIAFDTEGFMDSSRKNFEAIAEAQKLSMASYQNIIEKQSALLSQIIEDNAHIAQELISEGTPEQKVSKHTDLLRKNYEKSLANLQEIGNLLSKSNEKATNVISKRLTASLEEIQALVKTSTKAKTKKAA